MTKHEPYRDNYYGWTGDTLRPRNSHTGLSTRLKTGAAIATLLGGGMVAKVIYDVNQATPEKPSEPQELINRGTSESTASYVQKISEEQSSVVDTDVSSKSR